MAFCVYYRFNLLAVETVPALVLDEGIAARYPPVLCAYERGASTARRPKPNAVISLEEAGQHVLRRARRLAVLEWYEDHLVARARFAIPRAVLADEGAVGHLVRKQIAGVERQPKRGRMRAKCIIRRHRLLHEIGPSRLDA